MTEIDWKARAKAAEASTASLLEEVETLKTALRQWHCPSCGGSKVYVNRSRERGNEMVPCKVCAQTGLNAVARQVLSDLPRSPGVESVFAAADANQPAPKMPIRLDVFQVLSDWRNIVREGDIIGLDPVADPFIDRLFALFSHPAADANGQALMDIAAERRRQMQIEGWTPAHDDEHVDRSLALAAACYAMFASVSDGARDATSLPASMTTTGKPIHGWAAWLEIWPWDRKWWKPKDRRRDLIRAGALIVAEIERLDRLALAHPSHQAASAAASKNKLPGEPEL